MTKAASGLAIRIAALSVLAALLSATAAIAEAPLKTGWTKEIVVATAAEFQAALGVVKAGQAISLQPGRYDKLSVQKFRPDGFVVVRSSDPNRPARIGALIVGGSEYLWFQQVVFATTPGIADPQKGAVALIRDSRAIGIVGSEFHGSVDGIYTNDPIGANVLDVDDVVFAGNQFHDLARGVILGGVRKARVSGNRFIDLRTDGANFAGVQDVVIEDNFFTRFHPAPGDHADFIQFWQRNARIDDTRNVVIRGNTLLQGNANGIQGIFVGNEVAGRLYRNFVIENNVIYNSSSHGISLYDVVDGRVANNTLVAFPGGRDRPRINLSGTRAIQVIRNVTPGVSQVESSDVAVERNIETGRAAAHSELHPERLFVNAGAGQDADRSSFLPMAGGRLDRPGNERVGASPLPVASPAIRTDASAIR